MFKNHLNIALRHLRRKKLSTFINVFGLSLGLACCILMAVFAKHEWAFDSFHKNKDNLFRIVTQRFLPNGEADKFIRIDALYPLWFVEASKDDLPGIVRASAFSLNRKVQIAQGDQTFQQAVGLVNNDFLSMFTFPLLAGDPGTALARPDGVVITETVAQKLFWGTKKNDYSSLLGRSLKIKKKDFVITGVMADIPKTSSLQFDVLISRENRGFGTAMISGQIFTSVYVQTVDRQSTHLVEALNRWDSKGKFGDLIAFNLSGKNAFQLFLQPLKDVYGNTDIPNIYTLQSDLTIVYILWGFAGLVLIIACINFTILSVAESSGRTIEVGLRKVFGANQVQIMRQFWGESLVLSFFSLLLGVALAELFLPVFNGFIHRDLTLSYFNDGFSLIVLFTLMGLLAGSYTAIVLSRVQPVEALKSELRIGGRKRLTSLLVVVQFAVSITLLICIGTMLLQQNYIHNKDLGYTRQKMAVIRLSFRRHGMTEKVAESYKQAILKNPRIAGIAMTDQPFFHPIHTVDAYPLSNGTKISLPIIAVDTNYLTTLEIPLLKGRNFSEVHPTDKKEAVIINETLAKQLHLEDPVGKVLPEFELREMKDPVIIGVVRDFHFESLHKKIKPAVLQMHHFEHEPFMLVRMNPGNLFETITMLKETWHAIVPDKPIELSLLDEMLSQAYLDEDYWSQVLVYSAILTLMISLLGLFGLSSLTATQRTKEIGIRKVMGASGGRLVWLLSKDFGKFFLIANAIAWPVAYWIMDEWLTTNFVYRIDLGIWVFIFVGVLTYVVAQVTILGHILKVTRRNPVDALRYE